MAEANWFWAEGENRNGPVTGSAIARLVADGKLGAEDMIWKEGMTDWIPVRKVPALLKYIKQPAAPAAQSPSGPPAQTGSPLPGFQSPQQMVSPVAEPVSYYNPAGGLPPRAAATLRGHAAPRGDVGDWPLDDARVAQFDEALKLRKPIDAAAGLFKLLTVLMAIVCVIFVVGALFAAGVSSRSGSPIVVLAAAVALCLGLTVLYYFAWKATSRSHRWGSLTMGILFCIGAVFNLAQCAFVVATSPRDAGQALAGAGFSLLISGAFAYIAFRAFAAISRYLRQPAWCQELFAKTVK